MSILTKKNANASQAKLDLTDEGTFRYIMNIGNLIF